MIDLFLQVHEQDTTLRKQSSEMEAVLFRNQQLTRRISLLQEEAELAAKNKKSSRWRRDRSGSKERHNHSVGVHDTSDQVINEELVAKIKENAELRVCLNDIEAQHAANTELLKLRIADLEREKIDLTSGVKMRESEANDVANNLKHETEEMRTRISYLEQEIKDKNDKIVLLQVKLESSRDRCEVLEKKTAPVKKHDAETQFNFVDEEFEEKQASVMREKESLAERLETSLKKMKELEKDREHWKLEYQLMTLKLEKLKNISDNNSVPGDDNLSPDLDEILLAREEELKTVWEEKIDELISSRLEADSKAIAYYLEMEALSARLLSKRREGEKLSREASTARLEEDKVREEVVTIRENYESQLSAMSDHLAMMTGKLAQQEEIIHNLNFTIKENKRGKK